MQNFEIKHRFIQDDFGTHIAVSRDVGVLVARQLADKQTPFSVEYPVSADFARISVPPDGDVELLAQAAHDAETGTSIPINWNGEVAAIWARICNDQTGDAMEMCRQLTTPAQREQALKELRENEDA
jgi:hypothetical protein